MSATATQVEGEAVLKVDEIRREFFTAFVAESNRIEGILRSPLETEIIATEVFVVGPWPTVETIETLAKVYAGAMAELREREGMNVRVSNHVAPRGGPHIRARLGHLLKDLEDGDPFKFHVEYESLHPFMDGNGRTGRALWAWQMWRLNVPMLKLGFLHAFYYQSLSASRV